MRTFVPEVGIKGRHMLLHPTGAVGCNSLSLPSITSGTHVLIWIYHIHSILTCNIFIIDKTYMTPRQHRMSSGYNRLVNIRSYWI